MKLRLSPLLTIFALSFPIGALAGDARSGGDTTVFLTGKSAFERPLANITRENRRGFTIGNSFFNQNWISAPASTKGRDGLGPLFNARSCSSCHVQDGRGRPPTETESSVGLLIRLSLPGTNPHGGPRPHPVYGAQLQALALPDVEPEAKVEVKWNEVETGAFPDGETFSLRRPEFTLRDFAYGTPEEELLQSPRVAPAVFGLGLLEAIPETDILKAADPDDEDGDGISGKANFVWDEKHQSKRLGRFGWKANQPDLHQQSASAFHGDIGIRTELFPGDTVTVSQREKIGKDLHEPEPEADARVLERVTTYLRCLAPPARRDVNDPVNLRGEQLFHELNCAKCHVPTNQTGEVEGFVELSGQTIHAYTDLLLHDMGEGLADGRPDFDASGREWRTTPLWGIGLQETVNGHTFFLHDGRARNLTEAILWHAGEAKESAKTFRKLSKEDREALLKFLNSL
ncbi:MAG: di-heme oxidoredictase family protein [Verrucomicrobiota bacterium]